METNTYIFFWLLIQVPLKNTIDGKYLFFSEKPVRLSWNVESFYIIRTYLRSFKKISVVYI
jgi:hypothetical protein